MAFGPSFRFATVSGLLGVAGGLLPCVPAASAQTMMLGASPAAMIAVAESACANVAAPSPRFSPAMPTTVSGSKSAAILGGEMSALERLKLQQSGNETAQASQAITIPALAPAANGPRSLARFCKPKAITASVGLARSPLEALDANDFLASKRVKIGKTNFDRDWRRVRSEAVDRTLRQAFGRSVGTDLASVETVNRWVNREIAYVEDRDLFRKADYWAGARKTLQLRKGDCEDIALTKMQLLAAAGISRDDMFLTIARDRARNADHALLVVKVDGRFVLLDNATDLVLDGTPSYDYAPVLSFGGRATWLHGY